MVEEVEEMVALPLPEVVVVVEVVPPHRERQHQPQMFQVVLPVHRPQTYLLSEGQVVSVLLQQTVEVRNMVVVAVLVEIVVMFLVMVVVHYGVVLVVVRVQ
jgi:hypothetical protein